MALTSELNRPRLFIPSYLYRKGKIYYFRFALPKKHREYGGREIRLSLHTSYAREAKLLADALRLEAIACLSREPMLNANEIKSRLCRLMLKSIEQNSKRFTSIEDHPFYDPEEPDELKYKTTVIILKMMLLNRKWQEEAFFGHLQRYAKSKDESATRNNGDASMKQEFSLREFFSLMAKKHSKAIVIEDIFTQTEFEENKDVIGRMFIES
jgi:hypothetical protein